MRGGTENLYGIVGLEKAFELAYAHMDEWSEHILSLKNYFKEELKKYFDGIVFNGCEDNSLYTVLSVSFPENSKSEMLLLNLDIAGISCSGGSACTSGSEKGSHVIEALHQTEKMRTIRFSFSHLNTKNEIDRCINLLKNWCNLK
jgi:cysteine desulfurase